MTVRATGETPAGPTSGAGRGLRHRLLRVVVALAVVAAVMGVRATVVEPVRVSSASMEPTLFPKDLLLLEKLSTSAHPGDMVAFDDPQGTFTVKRVVALPGDKVEIQDADLYINDRRVPEPYVDHARIDGLFFGPVTVPAGSVFLLGDNRGRSVDSRIYGAIPTSHLRGRVVTRLWPRSHR
jgi:signal peptidase I